MFLNIFLIYLYSEHEDKNFVFGEKREIESTPHVWSKVHGSWTRSPQNYCPLAEYDILSDTHHINCRVHGALLCQMHSN